MVLEDIKSKYLEQRPFVALFLGVLYTFIGYGVAVFFFGENLSVAMLFLTTLLLVPTLVHLLADEEKREREAGTISFIKNHMDIAEVYLFLFIGVFVGYLILGFLLPASYESIFHFQTEYLTKQQGLSNELITSFLEGTFTPSLQHVAGVLSKNIPVALLFFILSVFYGAGAVFLVVLNASVFSSFIQFVVQHLSNRALDIVTILGFFSVHLIPEITGFLLAAIAGGVVSRAMLHESWGSKGFSNVMKDSVLLLLVSIIFIVVAAILEVYVTTWLFRVSF